MLVIAMEAPSDTKSNFYLLIMKIKSVESIRGYNGAGKIEHKSVGEPKHENVIYVPENRSNIVSDERPRETGLRRSFGIRIESAGCKRTKSGLNTSPHSEYKLSLWVSLRTFWHHNGS